MRIVGMIHDDWWGSMLIVNPGIINPTGFCFTNWFPRKQANKLHHSPLIEWETWRTGFRMKDLKVALKNEIVSHVLLSFYVLFGYSSASAGCCKKWPSLTLVMNHAPRRERRLKNWRRRTIAYCKGVTATSLMTIENERRCLFRRIIMGSFS